MTTSPLRVLIADDHPLFRFGLKAFLDSSEGVEVVAEASTGKEAVEGVATLHPDVVVMDLSMPDMNGLEATRLIRERHPEVAVLVLAAQAEDEALAEALRAGARGFLLKGSEGEATLRAIQAVAGGEAILGAPIADRGLSWAAAAQAKRPPRLFAQLTDREYDILELVAEGLSNRAIAERLSISLKTVRNRVSDILLKLGVADRPEAIVHAREAGLGRHASIQTE